MNALKLAAGMCLVTALAAPVAAQTERFALDVTVRGSIQPSIARSPSEHILTFTGPVQVPGVALAPGRYIFRFVAPSVMQVVADDRSFVYAMFAAIPASRRTPTTGYGVTLAVNRYDAPVRIGRFFLPGTTSGYEFVYPPLRPFQDFVVPFFEDVTAW